MLLAILVDKSEFWLPGPWLLSVGVTFALLVIAMIAGVLRLASKRSAEFVADLLHHRTMQWLLGFGAVGTLTALVGLFALQSNVASETLPAALAVSLARLPSASTNVQTIAVSAKTPANRLTIEAPPEEIERLEITSDQPVRVLATNPKKADDQQIYFVSSDRSALFQRDLNPVDAHMTEWTVDNPSDRDATVTVTISTGVEYPEVSSVLIAAIAFFSIIAAYAGIHAAFPKVSAIAMASSQEIMSQWLFWLVLVAGLLLLKPILLPIPSLLHIPYNTFGEDIKMFKQGAVRIVTVLTTLVALWSASVSISDELEGRTALTLLSKPVSRRQFLLGKFLGIVWPIVILTLIFGAVLLLSTSTKVVYDMRDSISDEDVTWRVCHREMMHTAPAIVLGGLETFVLAAISVALSTRLPMLANLVICASVYALGHLAPLVVQSSEGQFPAVAFIGQLFATILPVLDHFDVPGAIVGSAEVPIAYLAWSALYAALYAGAALLLALALFEDRDLA